jgi:hypothetical protein
MLGFNIITERGSNMSFQLQTLETIQNLVFPLVKTFTNFDPQAFVGSQAELFTHVGDAFGDIAALFTVCGVALEDGILTSEELQEIVTKAKTIPDAIDEIVAHLEKQPKQ